MSGNNAIVSSIRKTWLDRVGHPHSDELQLVGRLRRTGHNTLTDELTIEDPEAYTKTWNASLYFELNPDWDIGEFVCQEVLAAGHK